MMSAPNLAIENPALMADFTTKMQAVYTTALCRIALNLALKNLEDMMDKFVDEDTLPVLEAVCNMAVSAETIIIIPVLPVESFFFFLLTFKLYCVTNNKNALYLT